MTGLTNLKVIYHFGPDPKAEIPDLTGSYQVELVLNEDGELNVDQQALSFETVVGKPAHFPLTFSSMEDLKQFAIELCKVQKAAEVFIISTQDFNIALQTVKNRQDLQDAFRRYGLTLANEDILKKGGAWFSGINKIKPFKRSKN
jgi:hypothetical protein